MSEEKEFVNGLIFKLPHENAPDFVKGSLSIRREEMTEWLLSKGGEWINIDLKVSRAGKPYAEVSNWKPKQGVDDTPNQSPRGENPDNFDDNIPF